MLWRPGSSWGFGALLKGTSVVVLKAERALDIHCTEVTVFFTEVNSAHFHSFNEVVHSLNGNKMCQTKIGLKHARMDWQTNFKYIFSLSLSFKGAEMSFWTVPAHLTSGE